MLKRKSKESVIKALEDAQKFIFTPFAFQAVGSMLDLGILKCLDAKPSEEKEIIKELNLNEYIVQTLLQIGVLNNIIQEKDGVFSLTKAGRMFLCDDMTITNFNYVRDVCYLGASELTESFLKGQPKGLHKFLSKSKTIYPALPHLPEKVKKSWYDFDHFYSDNCFNEVFNIVKSKYNSIYDIGGNTGKFEMLCLENDKNFDITLLDLSINIENNKKNPKLKNCKFHSINVLDEKPNYPKFKNSAILMSQFLDCFSKDDIRKILTDISKNMDEDSAIYILEPYTDCQKYNGAEYSLAHISLYFTCMANGVSKMYSLKDMKDIIQKAGMKIIQRYDSIGAFDYTLLECQKK